MNRQKAALIGSCLASIGLVIGIASVFFPMNGGKGAPLAMIILGVGGGFYILGSYTVFWAERTLSERPQGKLMFWVRITFLAVILFHSYQIFTTPGVSREEQAPSSANINP